MTDAHAIACRYFDGRTTTPHAVTLRVENGDARTLPRSSEVRDVALVLSERFPSRGTDPRWAHWYDRDCELVIRGVDLVVPIVTVGWTCSTWMAIEGDTAVRCGRKLLAWNPGRCQIPLGMRPYVQRELPVQLGDVMAALIDAAC